MIQRASDLRVKEVVSMNDGKRLGYICDLEIDFNTGHIRSVIIPGGGKILGFIGRGDEFVVSWDRIKKIGLDVVLVDDSGLFEL